MLFSIFIQFCSKVPSIYSSSESSAVRSDACDEATVAAFELQVICWVLTLSSKLEESSRTSSSPSSTISPSGMIQMTVVPVLLSTWQVMSMFLALSAFPFPATSCRKVPRSTVAIITLEAEVCEEE